MCLEAEIEMPACGKFVIHNDYIAFCLSSFSFRCNVMCLHGGSLRPTKGIATAEGENRNDRLELFGGVYWRDVT